MTPMTPMAPMAQPDDESVRELLHRTMDEVAAPLDRLGREAVARGRRLRHRRRAGLAAVTCGAVLAIAVPAVSGDHGPPQVAADPGSDLPATLPISGAAGWWQLPADDMLTRLRSVLPEGTSLADPVVTNDDRAPGEGFGVMRGWLAADLVTGTRTSGGVNVVLRSPAGADPLGCTSETIDADAASCHLVLDDRGGLVGHTTTTTTGPVTVFEVVLRGPGDGQVYVAASNSADDKWGEGSTTASPDVPLTLAQLCTIAADPTWTGWRPAV